MNSFEVNLFLLWSINISNYIPSGIAVKVAYPCSYERAAWVQSLPSRTNEECLLSIDERKVITFLCSDVY